MTNVNTPDQGPIILFDGVCNFCSGAIQFVMRHERAPTLRFASLQSDEGQELVRAHGLDGDMNTMVVIEGQQARTKSDAALRIARELKMPWRLAGAFKIMPRAIRNWFYDRVAKNRYRLFGKADACMIPSKETRARFLDA